MAAPTLSPVAESLVSARARQDIALVQQALGGTEQAYTDLLHRYHKPVYHVLWKMVRHAAEAEDLTMEAFGKAFRQLKRYTPQYTFSTWLFRIATNHGIDFLRRKKLRTLSLSSPYPGSEGQDLFLEVSTPDLDPQEAYVRQQRRQVVQRAVSQLPAKYLRLVQMRYFAELSYEEIATELQLPLGTVKAQLFRTRELLLDVLQPQQSSL